MALFPSLTRAGCGIRNKTEIRKRAPEEISVWLLTLSRGDDESCAVVLIASRRCALQSSSGFASFA
jgi:hypothetical protein